jgi:hypothetical protein
LKVSGLNQIIITGKDQKTLIITVGIYIGYLVSQFQMVYSLGKIIDHFFNKSRQYKLCTNQFTVLRLRNKVIIDFKIIPIMSTVMKIFEFLNK